MFASPPTDDLFRSRYDHRIDQRLPLAVLASRMSWQEIEARVAQVFSRKGRAVWPCPTWIFSVNRRSVWPLLATPVAPVRRCAS